MVEELGWQWKYRNSSGRPNLAIISHFSRTRWNRFNSFFPSNFFYFLTLSWVKKSLLVTQKLYHDRQIFFYFLNWNICTLPFWDVCWPILWMFSSEWHRVHLKTKREKMENICINLTMQFKQFRLIKRKS